MGCTSSTAAHGPPTTLHVEPQAAGKAHHFSLAVNGSSGGLRAQQLLDMGVPKLDFRFRDGSHATVRIFSLKDEAQRTEGFAKVAELAADTDANDVRVVACGGDGTVKWVISCLSQVGALHVPVGVIPFGTGNDLANALGWGAKPPVPLIGEALHALKKRITMIYEAERVPLDVWICSVVVGEGEGAEFQEVKDKKVVTKRVEARTVREEMINYFSFGADGELMFKFEQNRTSTQAGNKLVYARKGFVQSIVPPPRLKAMVDTATMETESGAEPLNFRSNDRQLLFLNIPSYGAGADPWRRRRDKAVAEADTRTEGPSLTRQYVGDGKLEVLSIRSSKDVGVSLTTGSKAGIHRLTQGRGFSVTFKEGSTVFFQVDGEALKAVRAQSVRVEHGYQVQMLRAAGGRAAAFPPGFEAPAATAAALEVNEEDVEAIADQRKEQEPIADQQEEQVQVQEREQAAPADTDADAKVDTEVATSSGDADEQMESVPPKVTKAVPATAPKAETEDEEEEKQHEEKKGEDTKDDGGGAAKDGEETVEEAHAAGTGPGEAVAASRKAAMVDAGASSDSSTIVDDSEGA